MTVIPIVYDLCTTGLFTGVIPGGTYTSPSPYTSHTFQLDCSNLPALGYARWRIAWTWLSNSPSDSAIIRLYSQTPDSNGPKIPMAYFSGQYMRNPGTGHISNDATNLMVAHGWLPPEDTGYCGVSLQDLIAQGLFQNIGFDAAGDGVNPLTVYTSRLEVGWLLP